MYNSDPYRRFINDSDYGGFIISLNIQRGYPILFTNRKESAFPHLNGWTICSEADDNAYLRDFDNFTVAGATYIHSIAPVMLELFNAPYGTDVGWLYENNKHVGFYDLTRNCKTDLDTILGRSPQYYDV